MTIKDIIQIFENIKLEQGINAYRYVSKVFELAKKQHKRDFKGVDHEQSWRAFKGKNFEKLVYYIIEDAVLALNLRIINGNSLERTNDSNLSVEEEKVKRNLLVDFGEFGMHLPDVDMIIYDPNTFQIIAVISCKVTLRERIAQTGYWKIKLASSKITENIKVYFVTPDEDGTLMSMNHVKKGRAIVEIDTDGGYVLSETNIQESSKVKMFNHFIDDIRKNLDHKNA